MQQWLTGHKLKNRPYEILQILGEGGFGITYKAKSLALDIPVVIKTPNSRLQRDKNYSKYLANFTKEAKQLAKLGINPHPNIVRVFDFFEEDGLPCIVMDYIPGNSLYDLVQMNGALPEKQALRYIKQIGSALLVCHQQGIIHRDVHPNNILIHANSGKAILIDFGISGSTQTSRSNRSGNQAFAPWEQLISFGEESSKTPQVDIYTLAASFYYLVTGDTPTPSLARKFNNDELNEPKQYNSQISDRINEGILKGMEIEVKDRPQTVQAWLELFKQFQPKPTAKPEITNQISNSEPLITTSQSFNIQVSLNDREPNNNHIPKKEFQFTTVKIKKVEVTLDYLGFGLKKEVVLIKEHKQAKYFTEDLGNGITLDMVEIPTDSFMMGSPKDEARRIKRTESPQNNLLVTGFYMGKFVVTQAQWKQVASLSQIERELNPNPSYFKGNDLPVEQVSWLDAVEFCKRLSKASGKEYRLPSEPEWEYACRAGTTTPFYFGETITSDLANYNGSKTYANEPKGVCRENTTPAGSFPPNAFGLYDMHGNVEEWCEDDWYDNYQNKLIADSASYYQDKLIDDSASLIFRAKRSGSWGSHPKTCRSASRNKCNPTVQMNDIGFRVVLNLDKESLSRQKYF